MKIHDSKRVLRQGTPLAQATGALVLIHGRGTDAQDIIGLADYLPIKNLSLLAPDAYQNTWYPQRFFVPLQDNEPWLTEALDLIDTLVKEIREAGIPGHRIGIAGFSQGGCLALEYAMRNPSRYGFIAGLSSALIGPSKIERSAADLQSTPVLIACAESDPHIPLPFVEESAVMLENSNARLTKHIFRGSDHTVFPEEIAWLKEQMVSWDSAAA